MHRNRLAAGLCALPDPLAGFKGRSTGNWERERKGGSGRKERRGREMGTQIFETLLRLDLRATKSERLNCFNAALTV